jgi:hypothetical protein
LPGGWGTEDRPEGVEQLELLIGGALDRAKLGRGERATRVELTHQQVTADSERVERRKPGKHPAL